MNENSNQQTAQDVLQSSELTARLLRRLIASPGIIDLRQVPTRLMGWLARPVSLFDELIARYSIDDGSTGNQPLVMEQPWMRAVNAYLTNNSFSSTTNQFISITAMKSKAEGGRMKDERITIQDERLHSHPSSFRFPTSSSSIIPNPDAKTMLPDAAVVRAPAGRFRISRSHARRAWETAQVSHNEDEKVRPVKSEVEKIEQTRAMATSIRTPINLPPSEIQTATSQIQRKLSDEAANAPQPVSKANEIKDDRKLNESIQPTMTVTASIEFGSTNHTEEVKDSSRSSHPVLAQSGALTQASPTAFPLNRSAEDWNTSDEQSTDSDNRTGIVSKGVSREFVNHSSIRSDLESFDLVQMQNASSQFQRRPTDFVWRKGADIPTAHDLTSLISSGGGMLEAARPTVSVNSTAQSSQRNQTVTPESTSRTDKVQAGSGLTTERIVRNISRKLRIERERRGY